MSTDTISHDSANQRRRLLAELRRRPISTIEARRELDILHPAARVQELRRDHNIHTFWTDEGGHRVAKYVLLVAGK